MGARKGQEKREDIWIATSELTWTPGHAFDERLNELLDGEKFDEFAAVRWSGVLESRMIPCAHRQRPAKAHSRGKGVRSPAANEPGQRLPNAPWGRGGASATLQRPSSPENPAPSRLLAPFFSPQWSPFTPPLTCPPGCTANPVRKARKRPPSGRNRAPAARRPPAREAARRRTER
jgi:hypothetical protein